MGPGGPWPTPSPANPILLQISISDAIRATLAKTSYRRARVTSITKAQQSASCYCLLDHHIFSMSSQKRKTKWSRGQAKLQRQLISRAQSVPSLYRSLQRINHNLSPQRVLSSPCLIQQVNNNFFTIQLMHHPSFYSVAPIPTSTAACTHTHVFYAHVSYTHVFYTHALYTHVFCSHAFSIGFCTHAFYTH